METHTSAEIKQADVTAMCTISRVAMSILTALAQHFETWEERVVGLSDEGDD